MGYLKMAASYKMQQQTIFSFMTSVLVGASLFLGQAVGETAEGSPLQLITSDKLVNVVRSSKFVVIYLTSDDCHTCKQNQPIVEEALKTSSVEGLKAYILKDKSAAAKYEVFTFPTILFFRGELPLAYHSAANELSAEELGMWIQQNREISTKTLNDDDFEHLTQASTGATTGDWFVSFYDESCKSLLITWEAVASRLKHKLNVAKVDISTSPHLQKRFKIKDCPALIFFRLGKMYRYNLSKHNAASLVNFAEGWYKNMKAEKVLPPQSPFDEVIEALVEKIQNNLHGPKGMMYLAAAGCVAVVAFIITAVCCVQGVKSKQE